MATSRLRVFNGTSWVPKPLKRWTGSAWVEVQPKWWAGGQWNSDASPPAVIALVQRSNAYEALDRMELDGVAAGSTVIVCLARYLDNIASVTGSAGGAYTLVRRGTNDMNVGDIWIKANHPGGDEVITQSGGDYCSGGAAEFSGLVTSNPAGPNTAGTFSGSSGLTNSAVNPQASMLEIFCGGVTAVQEDNQMSIDTAGWSTLFVQQDSATYTGSISGFRIATAVETAAVRATAKNGFGSIDGPLATFKGA